MTVSAEPRARARDAAPWLLRWSLAVAACASVFPLLAWLYGLGTFRAWAALVAVPLIALLIASALWMARTGRWPSTRTAIVAGALGGLIGTFGYDLFRVPFVYGTGLRLLAPIDSYGVLLLGTDSSSSLTDFAGWTYHFVNGIGFGIAYVLVAAGRRWYWGVVWALVLETATIVSPFAGAYGLITDGEVKWAPIVLAYLAHIPYGIAIGVFGERAADTGTWGIRTLRAPVLAVVGALVVALAFWHQPLLPDDRVEAGHAIASGASAVIIEGTFYPTWLRIPVDGCAVVENRDAGSVSLSTGEVLSEGDRADLCSSDAGIHRIRVDDEPFSGGWLLVDQAMD